MCPCTVVFLVKDAVGSVYSGGENMGDFHPISATKTVLLSFNTVFSYNGMGGKDRRRQNLGGINTVPHDPGPGAHARLYGF